MAAIEPDPEATVSFLNEADALFTVSILTGGDLEDRRMPLLSSDVEMLCSQGVRVLVECREGTDDWDLLSRYAVAGAYLCRSRSELLRSNVILSVEMLSAEDISGIGSGQILASYIDFAKIQGLYLDLLVQRGICALGYDFVVGQRWNLLEASEVLQAHSALHKMMDYFRCAQGRLVGGFCGPHPTQACLIGNSHLISSMRQLLEALGAQVQIFDPDFPMPADALERSLSCSDIVLTHYRCFGSHQAIILSQEQVMKMPRGAILVDLGCGQQSCVETSNDERGFFMVEHVAHYVSSDSTKALPQTCTDFLSEFNRHWLERLCLSQNIDGVIYTCEGFRNGVYTYDHSLCNLELSVRFQRPYTHIDRIL